MCNQESERYTRFHPNDRGTDRRTPGQRDRDRVLYASAFRRLGGVTQVATAGERIVFHNRLTHSLEVAQIARRLAENIVEDQPHEAESLGGIDPDVVEAAALAHDLGHPPFGHVAEKELDDLLQDTRYTDGFEGNPQSFRIVTKLALRHQDFLGLNLTRATLNALLKYPWLREPAGLRKQKWGAYISEREEFLWARELGSSDQKSPEAALMDWADDIAYSVHDIDDFYRAGLIPLDRLLIDGEARARFLENVLRRWQNDSRRSTIPGYAELKGVFDGLTASMEVAHEQLLQPYTGVREQRASLRSLTASLIRRYITDAVSLQVPQSSEQSCVEIAPELQMEVDILKQLTWEYVITAPSLSTQQYGQRRLIRDLFSILSEAVSESNFDVFPPRYREFLDGTQRESENGETSLGSERIVADYIAGMTEREAIELHQRLTGRALGSVLDPLSS